MTGMRLGGLLALAAWAWLGTALPARGELYRCQGPDGRVTFTDNAAACPGARKHESRGELQTVTTPPPPRPRAADPAAPPPSLAEQAEASAEASWRAKKARSEQELALLEQEREGLRQAVTWCNRGGGLWRRDETGIKHGVSCEEVQREFREIEPRIARLRAYLDGGLEEECRRAGCLPGWIR